MLSAHEQVDCVCDDFGVGLQGAFVTVHFEVAAVYAVAGEFAVVNDCPV